MWFASRSLNKCPSFRNKEFSLDHCMSALGRTYGESKKKKLKPENYDYNTTFEKHFVHSYFLELLSFLLFLFTLSVSLSVSLSLSVCLSVPLSLSV